MIEQHAYVFPTVSPADRLELRESLRQVRRQSLLDGPSARDDGRDRRRRSEPRDA